MSAVPTIVGPIRRITCREFEQMIDSGVFGENEKLELIDGVITEMSPQSPRHSYALSRLNRYLSRITKEHHLVLIQQPVWVGERSLLEPDAAVVPVGLLGTEHPRAEKALLIVEVSLSSMAIDREKARLYAQAGAPELWILDVEGRRIEVHQEPSSIGYGVVLILNEFHDVSAEFAKDQPIPVSEFFPGRE